MTQSESAGGAAALMQALAGQGIHSLLVRFTDVHGVAKGKLLPLAQWPTLLNPGAGFAGPSIAGTGLPRTGVRSEFYARWCGRMAPIALPWWPGVALVVADGFVADACFAACPRQVLKRQLARLAERGWVLKTGIEPEFFLLRHAQGHWQAADAADRLDKPSYDLKALPRAAGFLHELRLALESAGMTVLQFDHEDAHGQFELNVAFDEALASCDNLMLFKQAAHALAEQRGWVLSMMPKPFANQPGSGMHFHVSLWDGDTSLFEAAAQPGLSLLGQQFVAGVLAHANALCALAAPTVNSYKRLTVGESLSGTTWAPAVVAHGPNNRTALVRTLHGRFEWRLPDGACNPYLATAALVAAGLDGIDRALEPGPAITADLFDQSPAQWRAQGLAVLPQTLHEACDALEADAVVSAALGPELAAQFLLLKRAEATAYARHVSAWELERYAAAF